MYSFFVCFESDAARGNQRLTREAVLWSRVHHENVAGFLGVMNDPISQLPGLVMSFVHHGLFEYLDSVPGHGQNRRIVSDDVSSSTLVAHSAPLASTNRTWFRIPSFDVVHNTWRRPTGKYQNIPV